MSAKTRTRTKTRRGTKTRNGDFLNRREAALLADVSLRSVDKAIEEKVVRPRRPDVVVGTVLDGDDVLTIAVIAKTGLQLQPKTKKQIRSWVRTFRQQTPSKAPEFSLSDVLVIRPDPTFKAIVQQLDSYLEDRERYIEVNPEIRGGEPVIVGTRLPVRAVAQRINRGDSVDDLAEDYPDLPSKAFEAALIYAQSHPRRGRPARPWRDA